LVRDAQSARQELLADIQLQRDREAQHEIDMRRDLYDLSRQSSRAAALEAELNCLKANIGSFTVAPVQSDDIPPPEVDTAMQLPSSRPVSPIDGIVVQDLPAHLSQQQRRPPVSIVHRPNITDALTSSSYAADVNAEYGYYATDTSTLRPPFLSSEVDELIAQYSQPQPYDLGYLRQHSDTPSRRPAAVVSDPAHVFPRLPPETAGTQFAVTSMVPRPPVPSRDDVMTSTALPHPPAVSVDHVLTSALPRLPAVPTHDVMTSMLPGQPAEMPLSTTIRVRSPSTHDVLTSTVPRPPPMDDVLTSALPRPFIAPGDFAYSDDLMLTVVMCVHILLIVYWHTCLRHSR